MLATILAAHAEPMALNCTLIAAQMTFVLTKVSSGWKIAAWTWTGPEGVPVN